MTIDSDKELVVAAQQGSGPALDGLALRWWSRMRSWARGAGASERDAEDVAQNAWIKLQRHLDRIDPDRPLAAWLKTVTRNAARDLHSAPLDELPETLLFPGEDAEQRASNRQAVGQALLAFDRLPARQRTIIELVDVQGLTPTEAAQRLGITPSATRASLTYARKSVRTHLMEKP